MTLTLKFDLLFIKKNLTLAIASQPEEAEISYVNSLCEDLSMGTKNFDLVTLTLKFDLFKKKSLTLAIVS